MKSRVIEAVLLQMTEGYEEQLFLYRKMYELAAEQEKVIQAEEIDEGRLFDLIEQRQDLIGRLEISKGKTAGLREEVAALLSLLEFNLSCLKEHLPGREVDGLEKTWGKLGDILVQIKDLDKKNEAALRCHIERAAGRLREIQQSKKAQKAYRRKPVVCDGVFVDYSE